MHLWRPTKTISRFFIGKPGHFFYHRISKAESIDFYKVKHQSKFNRIQPAEPGKPRRMTSKNTTAFVDLEGNKSVSKKKAASNGYDVPADAEVIEEGMGKIIFKKGKVFYNEVQVKNRDLSVLVINAYSQQLVEEARIQIEHRKKNVPWRKLPPSWRTWGRDYIKNDPILAKAHAEKSRSGKSVNPEEIDVSEEDFKLEGLFILEALGASGLRSIRYFSEITDGVGVERIICNDLEPHAVEAMTQNIEFNASLMADKASAQRMRETLTPHLGDGVEKMISHRLNSSQKTQHTRILQYIKKMSLLSKTDEQKAATTEEDNGYKRNYEKDAFDVIDVDPYGSCSIFLDSAVQSVRDGGLLCVTSTDLATMCGKNLEVCFAKYSCMALKGKYGHEFAIRIILGSLERHANRHGRFIVPLLSIQTDFYLRCFVRVYSNKAEIKKSALKLGMIAQSSGCDSFYVQPLGKHIKEVHKPAPVTIPNVCPETGESIKLGGPIWTSPIHNMAFVNHLLSMFRNVSSKKGATDNPYLSHWEKKDYKNEDSRPSTDSKKFNPNNLQSASMLKGILTAVSEELNTSDSVLFYHLPNMCKLLRTSVPPLIRFQSAIVHAGYQVSQVHCDPTGVKTNAPPEVLWDILRAWVRELEPENPIFNDVSEAAEEEEEEDPIKKEKTHEIKDEKKVEANGETSPQYRMHFPDKEERDIIRNKILSKPCKINVKFNPHPDILRRMRKRKGNDAHDKNKNVEKVARWGANPKPNWGPKSRAEGNSRLQTHKRKKGGSYRGQKKRR